MYFESEVKEHVKAHREFDQLILYEIILNCDLFSAIRLSSTCTEARTAFQHVKKDKLTLENDTISDPSFCNAWLHDLEEESMLYINARLEDYESKYRIMIAKVLSSVNVSQQIFRHFSIALYYQKNHLVIFNLYDWLRLKIAFAFALAF